MGKKIKTSFDVETGRSEAIIWVKGKRYRGTAVTIAADKDVMNSYTGQTIALAKAEIKREESKTMGFAKEIRKNRAAIARLCEQQANSMVKVVKMKADLEGYIDDKANFANQLRDTRVKKEGIKEGEKA